MFLKLTIVPGYWSNEIEVQFPLRPVKLPLIIITMLKRVFSHKFKNL